MNYRSSLFQKFLLILRTLRYLSFRQLFFQLWYKVRNLLFRNDCILIASNPVSCPESGLSVYCSFIDYYTAFIPPLTFQFLNLRHSFSDTINWNYAEKQKLWVYNLNYFDFLHQPDMSGEIGLQLIYDYVANFNDVKVGKDPYPTSLRIINWVKFYLNCNLYDTLIFSSIREQTRFLSKNLEYHILANHLLENAFALVVGSAFCNETRLFQKGWKLLEGQLNEQILSDGAHYERSPMYHQIILVRLLDTINLMKSRSGYQPFVDFMTKKAQMMLGWLMEITSSGRLFPLFKDSAHGIAPTTGQILHYAERLLITPLKIELRDSGYRKFCGDDYTLLLDVGEITPSYQPGHSHADTFNFELWVRGSQCIVDTGISTYNPGLRRLWERGTTAHNTITIGDSNTSEIWASHRVGFRPSVIICRESEHSITAYHNGINLGKTRHQRKVDSYENKVELTDVILDNTSPDSEYTARFHFHPELSPVLIDNSLCRVENLCIQWEGSAIAQIDDYLYAPEFNKLVVGKVLTLKFRQQLKISLIVI